MSNKEDVLIHEIIKVIKKERNGKTTSESMIPESQILESTEYLKDSYNYKIKGIIEDEVFLEKKLRDMESGSWDKKTKQNIKLKPIKTYLLDKLERDITKINYNYDKFLSSKLSRKGQYKKNKHIIENEVLHKIYIPLYDDLKSLYDLKERKYMKDIVDLDVLHREILKKSNNFKCPICQFIVIDLSNNDHFLPQSKFPTLSVSRNNFLLACQKCNISKSNKIPEFPVFDLKSINYNFIDNYVNISVEFHNLDNFPSIKISPKDELTELDRNKVKNILDLYNVHDRYIEVFEYCDGVIAEIIKNTKNKIKFLNKINSNYDIKDVLEAERNEMFTRIEKDKSYKNFLKAYITADFDIREEYYLMDIMLFDTTLGASNEL